MKTTTTTTATGSEYRLAELNANLRFDEDDAIAAHDAWGFNCAPSALCAVLGVTPREVRGLLEPLGFGLKGHVNPTMMHDALDAAGAWTTLLYRSDAARAVYASGLAPEGVRGVVRVQFAGPWTVPGVPMKARYRATHWAAFDGPFVHDVNNPNCRWLSYADWAAHVLPALAAGIRRADGNWWPTHVIEVRKP